ncbi:MAG: NADH-quinone oxidoreductase subunit D-related protein [bacterium]
MENKSDFIKNLDKDIANVIIEYFFNHDNELVLKINLEDLKKICLYFFKDLKFYLLSAFAAAESKSESKNYCNNFKIRYIFSHSSIDLFIIVETQTDGVFPSLSADIPALNWYEREMKDLFGLIPEGHPDPRPLMLFPENYPQDMKNKDNFANDTHDTYVSPLNADNVASNMETNADKLNIGNSANDMQNRNSFNFNSAKYHPLRKDYPSGLRPEFKKYGEYNYNKDVKGDGVFNILVGPVHAGIIEPGHFRFCMSGEPILQLEIRHFWKHRGIEKIAEGKTIDEALSLAEKISGDHCVAHSLAFLSAAEKILDIKISERALYLRTIYAELERLLCNINDFAWLFQDAGYSFGAQETFVLKEDIMELNKYLSGSRFNKGVLSLGGINAGGNIDELKKKVLLEKLSDFKKRYLNLKKMLLNSSTIQERFEETGYINKETVLDLCALGLAARASGVSSDTRKEHPYLIYNKLHFNSKVLKNKDVFARLLIRFYDIEESFSIIAQCLNEMPAAESSISLNDADNNNNNNNNEMTWALGYCESQRGNIMHFVELDKRARISRWKIRDPSFHNWQLIEFAVIGDIIADFPIVNKSLNLSYAGNDL